MHPEDHDEPAKRGANTQSLFRLINERVEDLNANFRGILELQNWICECAKQTCVESITLSLGEYEDIRANLLRFVVAPSDDHVFEELFDDVVEKNDRFWVIEKRGTAAEIAASEDPRKAHVNPAFEGGREGSEIGGVDEADKPSTWRELSSATRPTRSKDRMLGGRKLYPSEPISPDLASPESAEPSGFPPHLT